MYCLQVYLLYAEITVLQLFEHIGIVLNPFIPFILIIKNIETLCFEFYFKFDKIFVKR